MRGLYKYQTAPGRWWACAEASDGVRVNIIRDRYERMQITPPFEQLRVEQDPAGYCLSLKCIAPGERLTRRD